jgi:hypothetical protein
MTGLFPSCREPKRVRQTCPVSVRSLIQQANSAIGAPRPLRARAPRAVFKPFGKLLVKFSENLRIWAHPVRIGTDGWRCGHAGPEGRVSPAVGRASEWWGAPLWSPTLRAPTSLIPDLIRGVHLRGPAGQPSSANAFDVGRRRSVHADRLKTPSRFLKHPSHPVALRVSSPARSLRPNPAGSAYPRFGAAAGRSARTGRRP